MSVAPLPPITLDELLARFITVKAWVRANQTIPQDAFIPPKDLQLSVTRHIHLTAAELRKIGQNVADQVTKTPKAPLHGRADVRVHQVTAQKLNTEAAPLAGNPNHAHVTGWPGEKSAQKIIALELAALAAYHPY